MATIQHIWSYFPLFSPIARPLIDYFPITLLTAYLSLEVFWVGGWYDFLAFVAWGVSHGTFVSLVESSLSSAVETLSGERKIVLVEVVEFLRDDSVVLAAGLAFTDSFCYFRFCITYVIWEACYCFLAVGTWEIILPSPSEC